MHIRQASVAGRQKKHADVITYDYITQKLGIAACYCKCCVMVRCPRDFSFLCSQLFCCPAVRVPRELQGGCSSNGSVQMPSADAAVVTKGQDQQPAASLPLQAAPQHNTAPLQDLGVNNASPSSQYVPEPASRYAPAQP